jgi:hypothetical protein
MYTKVEDLNGVLKDGCAACGATVPLSTRECPVDWNAPVAGYAMVYDPSNNTWRPKCTMVYALEPPPEGFYKSIFLAGPTPRSMDVKSWRPEAIYALRALGYDGVIFVPEPRDGKWGEYDHQTAWEKRCRNLARIILYWLPRDMATMPGLTTNNEWGNDNDSGKVVLGTPPNAKSVRYQHKEAREYGVPLANTLECTRITSDWMSATSLPASAVRRPRQCPTFTCTSCRVLKGTGCICPGQDRSARDGHARIYHRRPQGGRTSSI